MSVHAACHRRHHLVQPSSLLGDAAGVLPLAVTYRGRERRVPHGVVSTGMHTVCVGGEGLQLCATLTFAARRLLRSSSSFGSLRRRCSRCNRGARVVNKCHQEPPTTTVARPKHSVCVTLLYILQGPRSALVAARVHHVIDGLVEGVVCNVQQLPLQLLSPPQRLDHVAPSHQLCTQLAQLEESLHVVLTMLAQAVALLRVGLCGEGRGRAA